MDHIQRETDSNPVADEAALSAVSKQEGDLEWKRFIQKELDKLENQEKDEGKEDSEEAPPAETEFTLSSLIEQIPVEKLIGSAIRMFNKNTEPEETDDNPKKASIIENEDEKKIKKEKREKEKEKKERNQLTEKKRQIEESNNNYHEEKKKKKESNKEKEEEKKKKRRKKKRKERTRSIDREKTSNRRK
ncbi:hypothetical protein MGI18_06090 [Bacillus sp. OVS6]|nr:hypothetical protein MGI18_06090 [Bacillus sp. OVS6]